MKFSPEFREISPRQMEFMNRVPAKLMTVNINTLASLLSRDMVYVDRSGKDHIVKATVKGRQITTVIKKLNQVDFWSTLEDLRHEL